MAKIKEVLLVYNNRKRPVEFQAVPSNPSAEQKNLYNGVQQTFADILSIREGSSTSRHDMFYLQFECQDWGEKW